MSSKEENLNVPVIDIRPLVISESKPGDVAKTIESIGSACKEWGFFYILGHQVQPKFIEDVQRLSRAFFQRPKEFKDRVARTSTNFRGFSDSELTKRQLDWKEIFDFGSELIEREERKLDVDGNNQWPVGMPEFKETMLRYFDEMHGLAEKLMSAIFKSLGVDPSRIIKTDFRGSKDTSVVRMNYYPVCPDPNMHLGVGPHADPSALTILWQDMDVSSLQVEKDGVFYDVYPVSESFVVNIGDMVQVWSNGIYKAPVHRVLANHLSVRYSTPFFYTPSYHCNVEPLDVCVSETNPKRYRPINWGEFKKGRVEGDYADVGEEIQIKQYLIQG